jgi:hypothetical protein
MRHYGPTYVPPACGPIFTSRFDRRGGKGGDRGIGGEEGEEARGEEKRADEVTCDTTVLLTFLQPVVLFLRAFLTGEEERGRRKGRGGRGRKDEGRGRGEARRRRGRREE